MSDLNQKQFRGAYQLHMPLSAATEPHLRSALDHLLENPGSLLRPQIVFQVSTSYGLDEARAMELAVALEYFHTASLVFDDLPCMDDAQQRRGAECVHMKFGEASGMLAALALINRAYALTWRAVAGCTSDQHLWESRALAYMEQRLGPEGLLGGQSLDLHYSDLPHNARTTERIAIGKTVSLIRLTLVLPAIVGGAPEGEIRCLERLALFWGLSYQILDDMKDVFECSAATGKTGARDETLGRPNIALAIGVNESVERLSRFLRIGDKALRSLEASRPAMSFLGKLRNNLQTEVARLAEAACDVAGHGNA